MVKSLQGCGTSRRKGRRRKGGEKEREVDFRNWIPWLWGLEDPAHDGKLVGTDPGRASFAQEPKAVGRQNSFLLKVSQAGFCFYAFN